MSFCAIPSFDFTFGLPDLLPGVPELPSFIIPLLFTMPPCPLD